VSRIRNAGQFRVQFQMACTHYETRYKPLLDRMRAEYLSTSPGMIPPYVDEALEAHTREYLINALLHALNWRMNCDLEEGLPSLMPEAPITSTERKTTRFLDYLGFERETQKPLFIVEAKRLKSPLPQRKEIVQKDKFRTPTDDLPDIICEGLGGTDLIPGEWNKWLGTLRDYVCSVKEKAGYAPQRVVITNGNWLVLFTDPVDAFLGSAPDPARIAIWRDHDDINRRYAELFQWLEYFSVSGEKLSLSVEELRFHIAPESVDCVVHGLRVQYFEEPGFYVYQPSPMIKVSPILFLHVCQGIWVRVEESNESCIKRLPHKYEELPEHLDTIAGLATGLLERVNEVLGISLVPSSLISHYNNPALFDERLGVEEVSFRLDTRSTEYLVVTGSNTHYLLQQPSVSGCPYHNWSAAKQKGVESNPEPVFKRRVNDPRSFFKSGEAHHCAHGGVAKAKASPITPESFNQCSPRSGRFGHAFCEIAGFEEHLCCRACAFEDVCTKSPIFHLPCKHTDGQGSVVKHSSG
jgi:hypothetical protein